MSRDTEPGLGYAETQPSDRPSHEIYPPAGSDSDLATPNGNGNGAHHHYDPRIADMWRAWNGDGGRDLGMRGDLVDNTRALKEIRNELIRNEGAAQLQTEQLIRDFERREKVRDEALNERLDALAKQRRSHPLVTSILVLCAVVATVAMAAMAIPTLRAW